MRPTISAHPSTTTSTAGFRHWNSPVPYLFVGLALMLGLIAVALVILVCSFKKPASSQPRISDTDDQEKPAKAPVEVLELEMEPKIVVIMAGDDKPTCLAMPASAKRHTVESGIKCIA
ncbi:hypothetical protein RJ639_002985 [Escallonia herrerae]|uniref:Uncharacterized protein n=1 Tax=Escallonia herrerae TaxID=1293975 RepID=A0AA89AWS3_9ASTE|nr:hypothetical protein RJ639_002985 [Escallonia herrerae]